MRLLLSLLSIIFAMSFAEAQPTEISPTEAERLETLFAEANTLSGPYISINGRAKLTPDIDKLTTALSIYDEILGKAPGHWPSYFMAGKIYQATGNAEASYDAFMRAYHLNAGNHDVVNETSIMALEVDNLASAKSITEVGLLAFPDSLALRARLALVELLLGDLDNAKSSANSALQLAPEDAVTHTLLTIIEEVQSGERSQPHSIQDLY